MLGDQISDDNREAILVVDDDHWTRTALAMVVRSAGYRVVEAAGRSEALLAVEVEPIIAALVDLVLENGETGAEVAGELRRRGIPCIAISGNLSAVGVPRDDSLFAAELIKPIGVSDLVEAFGKARKR